MIKGSSGSLRLDYMYLVVAAWCVYEINTFALDVRKTNDVLYVHAVFANIFIDTHLCISHEREYMSVG